MRFKILNQAAIGVVGFVSSFFASMGIRACRFHPTCSMYARQAFGELGFLRAVFLAGRRLLRCHPFSPGGFDPLRREK